VLALLIHFILLSTVRYNWLQGPATKGRVPAAQMAPLPPNSDTIETVMMAEVAPARPFSRPPSCAEKAALIIVWPKTMLYRRDIDCNLLF
jgi:hypothetical protein